MGLLSAVGALSSFITLESEIRNIIQAGAKSYKIHELEKLCSTFDFSTLSEELASIADKAEGYLSRKKSDILGESLFSSAEKEEFIENFFVMHADALPYRGEVEKLLLNYINQLESNLLSNMSVGEKANYHKGQQIKKDTEQIKADTAEIKARLNELSAGGPAVAPIPLDAVPKTLYDIPGDYIPRKVVPREVAMLSELERIFREDRPIALIKAFEAGSHLLLLSDAGHGKSMELQNLAGVLCETPSFPFLYSLSLYCGEPICVLLPESYQTLPPDRLVLLFDGYDELPATERDKFMRRLQSFIKGNAPVKVVISSRSNFCNTEIGNHSRTFQGFQVYHLDELSNDDILNYLSGQAINTDHFLEAAEQSGTASLLPNPFYLTRLVRLYQKNCQLPGKAEVMDYLITESFQLDDQKFLGSLEEQRRDLFILLEKTAFSMQLMQKQVLHDSEEYQELFTLEERSLLKHSGLLRKEGTSWRFTHNNFKEYLSAKYLSKLSQEESIRYFSDGYDIKMSWVNTFGFLLSLEQKWDLKSWVLAHAPAALIKFDPDHLEADIRVDIFKSVFLEREHAMLWLSDGMYSLEQLAAFACCEESLEFLLDRISNPVHRTSQISAIQLLQYFPRLFGCQEETAQTLLSCCTIPVNGDDGLFYNAMEALSKLELVTPEIASELVARYKDCSVVHVRWGMYRLLLCSDQHDTHVQFFLDGIAYTHGNNRIANETIALVDGLKALTEPESIQTALSYLAQAGRIALFEEDEVYETLCNKATEQFLQGQTEYYQTLINSYIASAKHCWQRKMRVIVHFFEVTGTIEDAVIDLCNSVERCFDLDALFYHPENLAYAGKAYGNGKIKNCTIFRDIVERYADDAQYQEYKSLILKIDGVTLPERKPHIDYEKLRQKNKQVYFDMLFDKAKMEQLLLLYLQKTDLPDPTLKDLTHLLTHSCEDFLHISPIWMLCCDLHRYFLDSVKAKNIFQLLDWTQFVVSEAASSIQHVSSLQVSDKQKSALRKLVLSLYAQSFLENAVTYKENSTQVTSFAVSAVFLTIYLDLVPEETALLQMTELPAFCFSEKDDTLKYAFLRSHLPDEALQQRIIENVKGGKVHGSVLQDHIQYCAENGWEDIRNASIVAIKTDEFARGAAILYLYGLFGPHCIQKEILPEADQALLLDIDRLCPDFPKEQLRVAMEREFQAMPSLTLMAHLLSFGSGVALLEYIRLTERDKAPPENESNSIGGPTEMISRLQNPELLPLLERLMGIALSADFQDGQFCSLSSSLSNALVRCGNIVPEKVMEILKSHQGTPDENEYAFRFCSYTMDLLKQNMRIKLDEPWKLCDVKHTLKAIS